jgi:signal transduction histidine kinase
MSLDAAENRPTILIVDDMPANLSLLSDLLDDAGFEVWIAQSGEVALDRVNFATPDLILLDVMMPGIDGFETCRRLKANSQTSTIPIIFMTALSEVDDKVRGLNLGAVDYITKPFQQDEVLARVRLHLRLQSLTKALADRNQELEVRVAERTAALEKALADLQDTHLSLVRAEKLSSLGQLLSGVAHEINNPVNFIHGNLVHACNYAEDLMNVLQLYQMFYPEPPADLATQTQDLDLPFMMEDFPKILESMRLGTDRIRDLVASLRNFSRMGNQQLAPADLHEGLENTLIILRHRLKSKGSRSEFKIIRDYGELPPVECSIGEMGQVFMNLIANAIDALDGLDWEHMSGLEPEIKIQTRSLNQKWVQIIISDNGPGIEPEVQQKLFEAFFTTKPTGIGTGLGLAIARSIVVDRHGGRLDCQSQIGHGATFILEIPVTQT